jgi:hypothetical protein
MSHLGRRRLSPFLTLHRVSVCYEGGYREICVLPFVFIYPLCKRFTHWPQAVLGAAFNWGVLMDGPRLQDISQREPC